MLEEYQSRIYGLKKSGKIILKIIIWIIDKVRQITTFKTNFTVKSDNSLYV
jgi:hypothetical protein